MADLIAARHAALTEQRAQALAEYERIEAALALLRRQLDAMDGGIFELAALLPVEHAPEAE